ncbi:putative Derlin-3 [Hibiscus syriacus]|uniref:Derlin-3 n=1 Tax=Hibiscus syriacus TaxID=106335 RepID=A0A6A2WA30_HIBSY|nr:putative Derlin-3 [Hibiscus syriacus]
MFISSSHREKPDHMHQYDGSIPIVQLIVESLATKFPQKIKHPGAGVYPTKTPCLCLQKHGNFPSQITLLPLSKGARDSPPESSTCAVGFHLDTLRLRHLSGKPVMLCVEVYTRCIGRTCGVSSGNLVGLVQVSIDLGVSQARPAVFQDGVIAAIADAITAVMGVIAGVVEGRATAKLLRTRSRFVFQFGGEPECTPVVFQIQGDIRQPVFSCKFSADRARSRSLPPDFSNKNRGCMMRTLAGEKEGKGREGKGRERKGKERMDGNDIRRSGSPVAAASIIMPFVPSPRTDRVSRSNPGPWLVLRPDGFSINSWKPWGHLEAWRERGPIQVTVENGDSAPLSALSTVIPLNCGRDGPLPALGYKFELVTEDGQSNGIPIAEATMSVKRGGLFCIDRKVGIQHVTCMADVALFIALSAAIDLSMDACRLFSRKLRKELCHDEQDSST